MLGSCQLLSKLRCRFDCSIARFPRSASEVCELSLQSFVLLVEIFTHAENTFRLLIAGCLCDRLLIPKHALLIVNAGPKALDNSHVVVDIGFPLNSVLTEAIGHLLRGTSCRWLPNSIALQHFDGVLEYMNRLG